MKHMARLSMLRASHECSLASLCSGGGMTSSTELSELATIVGNDSCEVCVLTL